MAQDIRTGQVTEDNLRVDYLLKKYDLTYLKPEQLALVHQQVANLIAEYDRINAETKVLRSTVPLNQSQTRLNNQNVQTQQRYAQLLGQQTLTEEQKTEFQTLQNYFGSEKAMADILNTIRPSSPAEFIHWLASGIRSGVKKYLGDGSSQGSAVNIESSLENIRRDWLRHKNAARK